MKYIIVGLGNFGSALAEKLTNAGHEVIGVDNKMSKVEAMKEKITHAICLNCSDPLAVSSLPLKNTDIVMICIGENEGANIMATALMKKSNVKRLISRSISPLHETILEAMGVTEIVRPEEETAERWVKKLTTTGVLDSFELIKGFHIIEIEVPAKFIGESIEAIGFIKNYNVIVLTTMKKTIQKSILGVSKTVIKEQGIPNATTVFTEGDIMVLYGKNEDIKRLMEE
jgi:trk system potassium uptake protein TrkA